MKLCISVSATKSYLHAWDACIRSIASAAAHYETADFVFATDTSEESKVAEEVLKRELPEGWKIHVLRIPIKDDAKDYERAAQMRIASLQGAAFAFARAKLRADLFWNVESDNIMPANALRVLEWTLQMPDANGNAVYDIAAGTYPNGLFLGGFGTPQNAIAEDFLPIERKLSVRLKRCLEVCEKRLAAKLPEKAAVDREMKRMGRLQKRVKRSSPDGNIWEVTAKYGWRRRGWMDFAYPGIGEGAVVPSDWCGLGCTLLSKHALALADFNGYDGGGTQDLFLCWHRWHPARLRIACVPHVVCDHVKKDKDGVVVHHRAYHELSGECRGHLRVRSQPWK